ncbi:MAG TPA: cellulase family glycosylhydrolase [Polyangiaceae bacterium]|nr:cellulase family glycosylhydrolase [Polyangiaceae bacterium]
MKLARWHSLSMALSLGLALPSSLVACAPAKIASPTPNVHESDANVTRDAPGFVRGDARFPFVGANVYYLNYVPRSDVLEVLDRATDMQLTVLRVWAFLDVGAFDGSVRHVHEEGAKRNVWFQAWDSERAAPIYNDGPDGLERLDFVLSEARRRGLTLILVLTNNWRDFGGVDQYLAWYGLENHAAFFSDVRTRSAYRSWMEHVVGRINSIDGVPYREDPTIAAWELANEPRVSNLPLLPGMAPPSPAPLTSWAHEMSQHLRTLAPNQMIGVGDEGFFEGDARPPYQLEGYGVDHAALTALPAIDFATAHLYPEHWGWTWPDSDDFIRRQSRLAARLGKPLVLEEFGVLAKTGEAVRRARYSDWTSQLEQAHGGWLFWHLAAQVDGAPYPDFDGYTIRSDAPGGALLGELAARARAPNATPASTGFVRVGR